MTNIAAERHFLAAQGLDIEYREHWFAAQDYTSARTVEAPALGFFLHIAVIPDDDTELPPGERARMRLIERIGEERFGIGFPYNAASFDTGRLYEGQPLSRRGAHTVNDKGVRRYGRKGRSLNYAFRALCLPQMVGDDVTDAQIDSAARWAAAQVRSGLAIRGATWDLHRTVAAKDCPGDAGAARLAELNRLTAHYAEAGLGRPTTPPEDDMKPFIQRLVDGGPNKKGLDELVFPDGAPLRNPTAEERSCFLAYFDTDKQVNTRQADVVRNAHRKALAALR